ncbi:MAG TPA: hypothetical protein VFX98_08195 [Longimicrobiaceae bacterium]|nr:hypothetical protein [Longimicrobiaceae bacterium]
MDIRLVRRNSRLWLWTGLLVAVSLLVWASSYLFGDPTVRRRASGAAAGFGENRAAVLPMETERFEAVLPLEDRELGRLLNLRGTAESRLAGGAVWVRTDPGRRILVRFEPTAPESFRLYPGSRLDVNGYLHKISRAEFEMWMDSLRVVLPRPRPSIKFGELPDSGFTAIDSLFIRNYYISVRPEGIRSRGASGPPPAAPRPAPRPALPRREPQLAPVLPAAPPAPPPVEPPPPDTLTP